jgi:hypothetical protein
MSLISQVVMLAYKSNLTAIQCVELWFAFGTAADTNRSRQRDSLDRHM